MPALPSFLDEIAARGNRDPLAPVTVVVPSHVAGIQLRRRLAEKGAFAGVRFETLPRLAELLGAGDLARDRKTPLARPIGDYLASQVAHEARADLADVRDLPGFGRVLRQTFRRLRRGGLRRPEEIPVGLDTGLLGEVVRLYGLYRARSSGFYDNEDLLDAAATAVNQHRATLVQELGDVYIVPPDALSASSQQLLSAIRRAVGAAHYKRQPEPTSQPKTSFVLAPDPASEAREVTREILSALEAGCGLHEVAVLHGADRSYRALLTQALASAGVPVSAMPGMPLSETAAGRGVLMLAELPLLNYSRTHTIDWLSLAPLRDFLPATNGEVAWLPAAWRRLAREAGITQGAERWDSGLGAVMTDIGSRLDDPDIDDYRRGRRETELRHVEELRGLIAELAGRLDPLRTHQPAAGFIKAFKAVVEAYFSPRAPALDAVLSQIDQLGTIDAVGGGFNFETFAGALRANLDAAYHREGSLGDGVLLAEYRLAAGMSFDQTILCGAYEGVFPAGPGAEPLVDDATWQDLRRGHPMIEDAALRAERTQAEALRAVASASQRLVWTAPLQAAGAGRDHYPSQMMLRAAKDRDDSLQSATDLRRAPPSAWLRRSPSPLAAQLAGAPVDLTEVRLRDSITTRRAGQPVEGGHPLVPALRLLTARRGESFGPYDGNLAELSDEDLVPSGAVSPTSLEHYASCGFRYYLHSVLRLRPPEEPDDREMMDAAEKGTLVHNLLQEFFASQKARGRPQPYEAWTDADRQELLALLDRHLDDARERGKTGLDVFAEHERRRLRADMSAFLEHDSVFRNETGAVPDAFELPIPENEVSGLRLRGFVDRIDRMPDGSAAWVIDYKTGSAYSYRGLKEDDPLAGGTKLQLPVYIVAARDAQTVMPLYWFISSAGGFGMLDFKPTPENMARYEKTLSAILEGIKGGVFPAAPGEVNDYRGSWENCVYCDFARLCSRRRDDDFEAKRGDRAMDPWQRVGPTALGARP